MHGAFSLAVLNKSRTREAPTPTNISTKSEPDSEKKGTLASPATALANRVLPVPGGPTSRAPLGILPPKTVYFCGFFKKSTISSISYLAPSSPATSLKETFSCEVSSNNCALDLPMLKMPIPPPGPPPRIERMENRISIRISSVGSIQKINSKPQLRLLSSVVGISYSCSTWLRTSVLSLASALLTAFSWMARRFSLNTW